MSANRLKLNMTRRSISG